MRGWDGNRGEEESDLLDRQAGLGWMDEWMDGWMDGWIERESIMMGLHEWVNACVREIAM